MSRAADQVWNALVSLVMDTLSDWRRRITEATGVPFGQYRVLRRLIDGPLALHALAESAGIDAPATTVAVNDLERRGLVVRQTHPTNRRMKLVSITRAGREVVMRGKSVTERAPEAFASLSAAQLAAIAKVAGKIGKR